MTTRLFETLLEEFSNASGIKNLKPDANDSCLIVFPEEGPQIQLEIDKTHEFLIIGSQLGFVPPGRYRENIFKVALQANNLPAPRYGDFAYAERKSQLILFTTLNLKDLNGEKINAAFAPFVEKATLWHTAIAQGDTPSLHGSFAARKGGSGMFGL